MARGAEHDETPGGDSFLDIVANIVGILVLLVVVVGVRAGRDIAKAPPRPTADTAEVVEQAKHAIREALLSRRDVAELIEQAAFTQTESSLRDRVRAELAGYVAALRAELNQERAKLSEPDRREFETNAELAKAQLEIEELSRRQLALLGADPSTDTTRIEIDPTPIVRERVEDEVWVKLEGDRVVYLPIDELRAELDYQESSARSALMSAPGDSAIIERVVGPIEGFSLRSLYQKKRIESRGEIWIVGGRVRSRLESHGQQISETVEDAIAPGSVLLSRLETVDSEQTVVTIVVYPDSFDTLTQLESCLKQREYRVAKAIQMESQPIVFGPSGRDRYVQ